MLLIRLIGLKSTGVVGFATLGISAMNEELIDNESSLLRWNLSNNLLKLCSNCFQHWLRQATLMPSGPMDLFESDSCNASVSFIASVASSRVNSLSRWSMYSFDNLLTLNSQC